MFIIIGILLAILKFCLTIFFGVSEAVASTGLLIVASDEAAKRRKKDE